MSLNVSTAIYEGLTRTLSKAGLTLTVVFLFIGVIGNVGFDSATIVLYEMAAEVGAEPLAPLPEGSTPFAFALPGSAIVLVLLVWMVVWMATSIATVRIMALAETESPTTDIIIDRLTIATLNELIARIIVMFMVGIGFLLLVIPGIFLAISLYFVRPLIAIDDRNFVDAIVESWELSKGNRFDVFVLLIVAVVIYALIVVPGMIGAVVLGPYPILASLIYMVLTAFATVFWLAVLARAYIQLIDFDEPTSEEEMALLAEAQEWDDPPSVDWR